MSLFATASKSGGGTALPIAWNLRRKGVAEKSSGLGNPCSAAHSR